MRLTIVLFLICTGHLNALSQITIKVVAADTIETAENISLGIEELLDSSGFNVIAGGSVNQLPLQQISFDNVFVYIKRYSKLKTFEIIIHRYNSLSRNKWHKENDELKHLARHRWIYEGDSVSQKFELLDSIAKQNWKTRPRSLYSQKRQGKRFFRGRSFSNNSPYLLDLYIEENPGSDNFMLNIHLLSGEKLRIPVGILTESTNAKRIQKLYSGFYKTYKRELTQRNEEWKAIDENYATYLQDYMSGFWSEDDIKRSSNGRRLNSGLMRGRSSSSSRARPLIADYLTTDSARVDVTAIYVVDFTNKSVYVFTSILSAYFNASNDIAIMVADKEDNLGILNPEEFKESKIENKKRSLVFSMEYSADTFLYDLIEMAKE